jgi:hypothetical protein
MSPKEMDVSHAAVTVYQRLNAFGVTFKTLVIRVDVKILLECISVNNITVYTTVYCIILRHKFRPRHSYSRAYLKYRMLQCSVSLPTVI